MCGLAECAQRMEIRDHVRRVGLTTKQLFRYVDASNSFDAGLGRNSFRNRHDLEAVCQYLLSRPQIITVFLYMKDRPNLTSEESGSQRTKTQINQLLDRLYFIKQTSKSFHVSKLLVSISQNPQGLSGVLGKTEAN
jgi:hypothetical protein